MDQAFSVTTQPLFFDYTRCRGRPRGVAMGDPTSTPTVIHTAAADALVISSLHTQNAGLRMFSPSPFTETGLAAEVKAAE